MSPFGYRVIVSREIYGRPPTSAICETGDQSVIGLSQIHKSTKLARSRRGAMFDKLLSTKCNSVKRVSDARGVILFILPPSTERNVKFVRLASGARLMVWLPKSKSNAVKPCKPASGCKLVTLVLLSTSKFNAVRFDSGEMLEICAPLSESSRKFVSPANGDKSRIGLVPIDRYVKLTSPASGCKLETLFSRSTSVVKFVSSAIGERSLIKLR